MYLLSSPIKCVQCCSALGFLIEPVPYNKLLDCSEFKAWKCSLPDTVNDQKQMQKNERRDPATWQFAA